MLVTRIGGFSIELCTYVSSSVFANYSMHLLNNYALQDLVWPIALSELSVFSIKSFLGFACDGTYAAVYGINPVLSVESRILMSVPLLVQAIWSNDHVWFLVWIWRLTLRQATSRTVRLDNLLGVALNLIHINTIFLLEKEVVATSVEAGLKHQSDGRALIDRSVSGILVVFVEDGFMSLLAAKLHVHQLPANRVTAELEVCLALSFKGVTTIDVLAGNRDGKLDRELGHLIQAFNVSIQKSIFFDCWCLMSLGHVPGHQRIQAVLDCGYMEANYGGVKGFSRESIGEVGVVGLDLTLRSINFIFRKIESRFASSKAEMAVTEQTS